MSEKINKKNKTIDEFFATVDCFTNNNIEVYEEESETESDCSMSSLDLNSITSDFRSVWKIPDPMIFPPDKQKKVALKYHQEYLKIFPQYSNYVFKDSELKELARELLEIPVEINNSITRFRNFFNKISPVFREGKFYKS